MNFLEICKRVRQECGISGDGPSNVSGQVGHYAKIVDWVKSAHEEIQTKQTNWRFDWANVEVALIAGQEYYSTSALGVDARSWDFDSMYVYDTASGPASRTWLTRADYPTYRHIRVPSVHGRPIHVAWTPDKRLGLYPIPQSGLTASLDYFRSPEVMTGNTTVPRIPAEYHMAIVWRAVMFFCGDEENPALYALAEKNFKSIMSKMEITELEGPLGAEPLA